MIGGGRGARPEGENDAAFDDGPADEGGGGGGGAGLDGFRPAGGGTGGFLPIGGGGFGLLKAASGEDDIVGAVGRRFARERGIEGIAGAALGGKGGAPGGRGAADLGNAGGTFAGAIGCETLLEDGSGSESYAPVLTPPDFLSFGIPPANSPPS